MSEVPETARAWDRVRRVVPTPLDAAIALSLATVLQLQLAFTDHAGVEVVNVLGGLLLTLPLVWRRRRPVAVVLAFAGTTVLQQVLGGDLFAGSPPLAAALIAGAVGSYSLGAHSEGRASVAGAVMGVLGLWISIVVSGEIDVESLGFSAGLVVAAPWLAGRVNRARNLRIATLEREQEHRARIAVSEERARIARELHDVVAHSVGVMVMQAQGASRKLDRDPERTREALHAIEDTGRTALAEMRRSLGVLRGEGGGAALEPLPGMDDLRSLIEGAREAGLHVEVTTEGEPRPLPFGVELSAYRIVQEAITNTLKHAGPVRAHVTVHYGEHDLQLAIRDEGEGRSRNGAAAGSGHGLVGMRERVALYGGELQAGPGDEGGFVVHARIPLTP